MIYDAPPTVAGFMNSSAFCRLIMGPVGSGKSTGCLMEVIKRAQQQTPGPDGVRRTRFAIVRATLQQIKLTVLKEFYTWVAPVTDFKVSESTIHLKWRDIVSEIHLIPLDDERDQQRLLSAQLTGIWCNEFPEIDPGLFPAMAGRVGRYPPSAAGGASWFGIIADGNFPTEGGEWHELLELNRPVDWDVWKQPGGLTTGAENLGNLLQTPTTIGLRVDDPVRIAQGRTYYERLARQHSPAWRRRYVDAEYGDDPSGTAVYKETFKLHWHVTDELAPNPGLPIIIGQDFGRNPWSLLCQLDSKGRLLVLEEVPGDTGLELHLRQNLRPAMAQERYMGHPVMVVGDPSGRHRDSLYEETAFDLLSRAGFNAVPAPTNDIDPRIRAVESFLIGSSNAGPAILIDKRRCPVLVRGFTGGYRFAHTRHGQAKPTPDKDNGDYSHPHDDLQYVACSVQNGITPMMATRIRGMNRRWGTPVEQRVTAAGWT